MAFGVHAPVQDSHSLLSKMHSLVTYLHTLEWLITLSGVLGIVKHVTANCTFGRKTAVASVNVYGAEAAMQRM